MLSIIKLRILRLKDDVAVFVLMTAMALGLTAVFGMSFNGYRPGVLIVDEEGSSYSQNLIREISKNNSYNFVETDIDDAAKKVEEGKVIVAIIIKNGFGEQILNGKNISVQFMKIKDDALILSLQQDVSRIILKMSGGFRIADITANYIQSLKPESDLGNLKRDAYENVMNSWKFKNPIEVNTTIFNSSSGSGYDGMMHSMIGFTIFFSMYTMVFSISTILSDKQYKTWQRMIMSPVSKSSILGGTMVVSYFTGAIQLLVLIAGGKLLFDIDWGNSTAGIIMVSAAFVFAVTCLGLMLSNVVKTQAQLGSLAPVILTSTSMLGGCMWPLEIVNNKILLFLAELTPQKWAMQGLENIASKGMSFEAAILPTLVLLGMGAIYFSFGVWGLYGKNSY